MSRTLKIVLLSMLVLAGAMSLKTIVAAHSDGSAVIAQGGAPVPNVPW